MGGVGGGGSGLRLLTAPFVDAPLMKFQNMNEKKLKTFITKGAHEWEINPT